MSALGLLGSLFIVVFSFFWAWFDDDPYILKRGGAALTAYSIFFALKAGAAEHKRLGFSERDDAPGPQSTRPSVEIAESEWKAFKKSMLHRFHIDALKALHAHVAFGIFGELLHGFGDLLAAPMFNSIVGLIKFSC